MFGRRIRFKARTHLEALLTKTIYSGDISEANSKTYERIDWEDGDEVLLAMTNETQTTPATQAYQITDITASGRDSKAGLEPASPSTNGLEWGTGTHDFWAAYPSTATAGDHTFSFPIPSAQRVSYLGKKNDVLRFAPDMSNAFMVAGLQSDPTNSGINLDFSPGFTTFDFTVGGNDNLTIASFEMETEAYETETSTIVPVCGTAVATFDTSDNMSYTFSTADSPAPGQKVTVTFDNGSGSDYHPEISTTTSLNFKVLALPRNLTGIVIRFRLVNGDTHSLKLKQNDSWLTFPAGVKYNISGLLIPGAVWYITYGYPREEQWITHPDIEIGVE